MGVQSKFISMKNFREKIFNSRRKRSDTNVEISNSSKIIINNQTKFVISYIIPGKCIPSNKPTNKQFQKKYSHLFKVNISN